MTSELCLFTADDVPDTGRSRAHRILTATEPVIELPALVRRGRAPQPITLQRAEQALRGLIKRCGALTVDVESSGYPVGHRHYQLRTVQLGNEAAAVVFDATHPPTPLQCASCWPPHPGYTKTCPAPEASEAASPPTPATSSSVRTSPASSYASPRRSPVTTTFAAWSSTT